MEYLMLAGGLCLLIGGAEFFVRGAVGLANRLKISPLVIGLTVVAFGTSAPELVVSVKAAMVGSPGIALGNVVGSNIANVLLVLGLTAAIQPVTCRRSDFFRDFFVLAASSIFLFIVCLYGTILRSHGIIMVLGLCAFLYYSYVNSKNKNISANAEVEEIAKLAQKGWPLIISVLIFGLVGIVFGADFLVRSAVKLALNFGVKDEVVGLTIVAVGTSLPELATSMVAAIRKQNDMAFGNIIGSNIWNILCIAGLTSAINPIKVADQIAFFDGAIMLASSLILLPFMITHNKLHRGEGVFLFVCYGFYLWAQVMLATGQDLPFMANF